VSLYQKGSDFSLYNLKLLNNPWVEEFEELLRFCDYGDPHKEEYLREAYYENNPSLFLWVRQFIKTRDSEDCRPEYFRENLQKKEYEHRGVFKLLPIYCELLRELEREGKLTDKMRKWAMVNFMECHLPLISSFEVYLLQSTPALTQRTKPS
jgi:hypothetical protein